MRRLFGSILLLFVVLGMGLITMPASADVDISTAPIGMIVQPSDEGILTTFKEAQQTPAPQDTPGPEEQTYGGFRLDFIIALVVLGGLTALSMVLGRIAKKNRKRN